MYIDNYIQTLENLGKEDIHLVCYNFMPVFDWTRTELARRRPDGSTVLAYTQKAIDALEPESMFASIKNDANGAILPAESVMKRCNELLACDSSLSARGIIQKSNVEFVGTTDDPADSLEWHEKLAKEERLSFTVRPSFRPGRAINIAKSGFAEYIGELAHSVGRKSLDTLRDVTTDALSERLEYFVSHGCVAADHGLDFVPFRMVTEEECDRIFQNAMRGESISAEDAEGYATSVLLALARQYSRLGVVMELHFLCLRNVNEGKFNELVGALIGCFQSPEIPGKIQQGPAWWFNDNRDGIEKQLKSLANCGIPGNFIGMLTDSRSFLSYTRHEYFRRILCNMLGGWVESGEYPDDDRMLRRITEGISYYNARHYFGLDRMV